MRDPGGTQTGRDRWSSRFYLYLFLFTFFRFGNVDLEDSIVEFSANLVAFHVRREPEGPLKRPEIAFPEEISFLLLFLFDLFLPSYGENVSRYVDVDVVGIQTGNFGFYLDMSVRLRYVDGRRPSSGLIRHRHFPEKPVPKRLHAPSRQGGRNSPNLLQGISSKAIFRCSTSHFCVPSIFFQNFFNDHLVSRTF